MVDEPRYTPLGAHRRVKKLLIAPLNELNIQEFQWKKDWLPEYLWIEALKSKYPDTYFKLYSSFMDEFDQFIYSDETVVGFISDFSKIPILKRDRFLSKNEGLIKKCFQDPIGKIISLYPECPANWLVGSEEFENEDEYTKCLEDLAQSVTRLLDSKGEYTGDLRIAPLSRYLKHGKIRFNSEMEGLDELIDMMSKYPGGLNRKDRVRCQQVCRTMLGGMLSIDNMNHGWSEHFWARNFELTGCIIKGLDANDINNENMQNARNLVKEINKRNFGLTVSFFSGVLEHYRFNPSNLSKDEVILGLFARMERLYSCILDNSVYCYDDISRILLRCLADTAITYMYLINEGDDELYNKFIEYGNGKEKLLMLNIQDKYPDALTPGETSEYLMESLGGGMSPEFVNIDLGNWIDISARDMAKKLDISEVYSSIYDPASADVHGMWHSVKRTNLTYCMNSLHGIHRIPTMRKNCHFETIDCATSLLQLVWEYSEVRLGLPRPKEDFVMVVDELKKLKIKAKWKST